MLSTNYKYFLTLKIAKNSTFIYVNMKLFHFNRRQYRIENSVLTTFTVFTIVFSLIIRNLNYKKYMLHMQKHLALENGIILNEEIIKD